MRKSSSRKVNSGIFSGQSTVFALGMLLVVLVVVSFYFIQQMRQETQSTVKGIMTQIYGQNQNQGGSIGNTFPIINRDIKLTCASCAYTTQSTTPSICLNSGSSTGAPYAHCALGPVSGESCATCPVTTPNPIPTCLPMPPQCQPGSTLGINCPVIPNGGWCPPTITPPSVSVTPFPTPPVGCYYTKDFCPMVMCSEFGCPPCKPRLICLSKTPPVVPPSPGVSVPPTGGNCTTTKVCDGIGQRFMCTFWNACGGCKDVTVCK